MFLPVTSRTRYSQGFSVGLNPLLPHPDVLKKNISKNKGETFFVESISEGGGKGQVANPQQDLQQKRIGSDPSEAPEKIRTAVQETLLACCRVSLELAERRRTFEEV